MATALLHRLRQQPLTFYSITLIVSTDWTSSLTTNTGSTEQPLVLLHPILWTHSIGFTGNEIDSRSAATTDGSLFYGSYFMWEDSDGTLSDVFRPKETDVSGIYQFNWDTSSLDPSGYSIPTVKDTLV
ncbi:hypothetical protein N7513_003697 [Penicillium frequentans]|nr:hypothetical protein N7513_003697 [Penicillium glabrum]